MLELITAGVELMLVGMGIVFTFLAMLIGAVNIMSKLVQRYFPEPQEIVLATTTAPKEDRATIAAISAAVHQYRTKYK